MPQGCVGQCCRFICTNIIIEPWPKRENIGRSASRPCTVYICRPNYYYIVFIQTRMPSVCTGSPRRRRRMNPAPTPSWLQTSTPRGSGSQPSQRQLISSTGKQFLKITFSLIKVKCLPLVIFLKSLMFSIDTHRSFQTPLQLSKC